MARLSQGRVRGHALVALALGCAIALIVVAQTAGGAKAALPAAITPHGTGVLRWDAGDLANPQLANNVMVLPIGATALKPVPNTVRLTSPIAGGSFRTTSPYWGPVRFAGGVRFLKLTPAATWTQVTVTKLTFNIKTQSVTASINGGPMMRFADVNEMGMTDHRFTRNGHLYVRIRGALLFYTAAARSALNSAFGYSLPSMEPVGTLSETIRLR
jgi:hypothetical protein